MNELSSDVPFRHCGLAVFVVPLALMVSGCAATSPQSASSPAVTPNPMFTITLHCEPGALDEDDVATSSIEPVASDGAIQDLASADPSDEPYECFSLLKAMQVGAETMAAQARYERSSTR